jgi:DNA (cytosine-5)-methyltransferase 1
MGYKLAWFDVIGCNEIDPRMMAAYQANHHPKYSFLEDIRTFKNRTDLPEELFHLDILDGSPPCSSFSMAGSREDGWGVEKKFREGQANQVLDTLFFDFIDLSKKLQPKVVIAENVKGLLLGEAREYYKKISFAFEDAGYEIQDFLLNAADMGVPQRRERVFFIGLRKDLAGPFMEQANLFYKKPTIEFIFKEKRITLEDMQVELGDEIGGCYREDWDRLKRGEEKKYIQSDLIFKTEVHPTILGGYRAKASPMPEWEPKWLNKSDLCKIGSFPQDYNFIKNKPQYIIGMSVPPLMTAKIAEQVWGQWLSKINNQEIK